MASINSHSATGAPKRRRYHLFVQSVQTHYHLGDILANAITHGIGAVLAIVGAVYLIAASTRGTAWVVVSCSIFSATLVLVYICSTLYHSLVRTRARHVFHILDHSAIYLLIAGTYTPFCLVTLRSPLGWTIFGVRGRWPSPESSSRALPWGASRWHRRWFTWGRAGLWWSRWCRSFTLSAGMDFSGWAPEAWRIRWGSFSSLWTGCATSTPPGISLCSPAALPTTLAFSFTLFRRGRERGVHNLGSLNRRLSRAAMIEAKPGHASASCVRQSVSAAIQLDSMTEPSTRPQTEHAAQSRLARLAAAASAWGPWQLFWLALGVRLAVVALCHYYRIKLEDDHFHFGAEMGRIARALATGRGYADPFLGPSGPTAWVTPLFPLILSGIFKLFGVYSTLSAWAVLIFDSLLNALMIPLIWETGERCFGPRTARWSAWIWALYPAAMQYAVKWIWETTLTAFLFQLALVIALRVACVGTPACDASGPLATRDDGPTWPRWLGFGLVWGLMALSNPGLLLFLPVCGLWMLARCGRSWPTHLPKAIAAGLVFLAVIAPWSWRNEEVFHQLVLPHKLWRGTLHGQRSGGDRHHDAPGPPHEESPAIRALPADGGAALFRMAGRVGPPGHSRRSSRFFRLCLTRIYYFWFGIPNEEFSLLVNFGRGLNYGFTSLAGLLGLALALRRRLPAAGLFAAAFLLLPAVYYIVTAHARFRHPLEPLITLLGVFLFQQAEPGWGCTLPGSPAALAGADRLHPASCRLTFTPQTRYTTLVWRFLPVAVEPDARPQFVT